VVLPELALVDLQRCDVIPAAKGKNARTRDPRRVRDLHGNQKKADSSFAKCTDDLVADLLIHLGCPCVYKPR
jgi:hypothetical protein